MNKVSLLRFEASLFCSLSLAAHFTFMRICFSCGGAYNTASRLEEAVTHGDPLTFPRS